MNNREPMTMQFSRFQHTVLGMLILGTLFGVQALSAQTVNTSNSGSRSSINPQIIDVGRFDAPSPVPPAPWQLITLSNNIKPTQYAVVRWDGVMAIESIADHSMALMARPLSIDLTKTPVLCWRWRIADVLQTADMRKKTGDDYAARVYVALKLPPQALGFGLRAKLALARSIYGEHVPDAALNYVWDNRFPTGTIAPNAYTDRTQMIVMRSGRQDIKRWVNERRDVLADATQLFGSYDHQAVSLAVASDTDNTGERAKAGFADMHFVSREQPCAL
jgi:Protein of unknown function (DUF3047)